MHNQNTTGLTRIISGGIKYNIERYIREALNIKSAKGNQNINLINQKEEWGHSGAGLDKMQISPYPTTCDN